MLRAGNGGFGEYESGIVVNLEISTYQVPRRGNFFLLLLFPNRCFLLLSFLFFLFFFFEERYDPSFTPYDLRLGCYGRNDMALLMTSDDDRYYEFMFRVPIMALFHFYLSCCSISFAIFPALFS
jgi:hypothetical protein